MNEYDFDDLKYLAVPLPEDLLKLKYYGAFKRMNRVIDYKMQQDIPLALKKRLIHEKAIINRMADEYPIDYQTALKMCHETFKDFNDDELIELQDQNAVEWIFIEGKPCFRSDFVDNIIKTRNDYVSRLIDETKNDSRTLNFKLLNETINEIKENKQMTYHFHLKTGIKLKSDYHQLVKVHLPLPIENAQVKNFKLLKTTPDYKLLNPGDSLGRCIYFESEAQEFTVEYEFDNVIHYQQLDANKVTKSQPQFYLQEQLPHIAFTPYLKALAKEIVGDETNNLLKAKKIYEYITTHVNYSFVRNYYCISSISEYVATGLKGDCGVQALLFITLCRIVGIPATWQAGLYVTPYDIGNHDWARFYVAPFGWLFADCSFGGSAYRNGDLNRWQYYFGHLDPFRMPACSEFQADLYPVKKYLRQDPYDNQTGEVELDDRGLYLKDYDVILEVIEAKKLDSH